MRYLTICLGILLLPINQSSAVIVGTGTGSGNTSAPADDPGFANVGVLGGASALYLGNGWVLTAAHVYNATSPPPTTTWFNYATYNIVPGSAVQLANPLGAGYTPYSDLEMYRLTTLPSLPSLPITPSAPAAGWQVTMIGFGHDRSNQQTANWTSTWGSSPTPSTYAGDIWADSHTMRWGTNVIDLSGVSSGIDTNSEASFMTSFTQNGTAFEAQGSSGDSGGGVFHKDPTTGQWSLAGVMFGINTLAGQPWGTAVFGDDTWSANLFPYRTEIYQTIGFPGDVNYDGVVNGQDIAITTSNWLKAGSGANSPAGDANHDGIVNGQDIALIAANWRSNFGSAAAAAVPEPPTEILTGVAALILLSLGMLRRLRGAA